MKLNRWWRRRPRFRILAANCASVSFGSRRSARAIRTAMRKVRQADVICVSEAADWLIRELINTDEWQIVQFGKLGSPESGLALLARVGKAQLLHPRLVVGSPETSEGGGIRMRPILVADVMLYRGGVWVDAGTVAAIHAPPARAPEARDLYMQNLARVKAEYKVGDFNLDEDKLESWLPRKHIRSIGVLSVAVANRHWAGKPRAVDIHSDHPGVLVNIRLR